MAAREVWIADWAGVVSVFDAGSLAPLASVQIADTREVQARGANHVAFDRDGQRAYVSSVDDVAVIDVKGRQVLNRIAVGQEPHELSLEDWVVPDATVITAATRPGTPMSGAPIATPAPAESELTRINDAGSVAVQVTPLNLKGSGATLDFQVVLETHAVELDYDLTEIAVLRDDVGNSPGKDHAAATIWTGCSSLPTAQRS